jgi:hypothetical protein
VSAVDVLAVLERMADHLRPIVANVHVVEHDKALAAVRELVAAARLANGDHTAPHDCYATGPMTGDPPLDLVRCPGCILAAALAAFKEPPK